MFLPISNVPRDYAWGSRTAIAELTGREPSGAPEAELWLGTHPGSPAVLADGRPLRDVVGELPYLLKLLAADAPLSLQAHPTTAQAQAGFARENAAGIPIDAPERNYKDDRHKPEMLYALSDEFRAITGFRPAAQTRAVLALDPAPEVAAFAARLTGDDAIETVFEWLISRGEGADALVAAVSASTAPGASWDSVRTLAAHAPGDPGIAISLLLHTVVLHRGEALYLPAGNIHAYLSGVGVELMASSDNVLRGGLTPKHVDVAELVAVLDFHPVAAPVLQPQEPEPGVRVFRPDVPDFALTVVDDGALRRGVELALSGPAIAVSLAGAQTLDGGSLAKGAAAYLDGERVRVGGTGLIAIATPGIR